MHHEVRIAADRRGEVRVLLRRQAEVTDVLRLVHRLRHRAHDHFLEQRLFGPADDRLERLRRRAGVRSPAISSWTPRRTGSASAPRCVLSGLPWIAVERGHLCLLRKRGRLDVRRDHAFLDQPVRVVARLLAMPGPALRHRSAPSPPARRSRARRAVALLAQRPERRMQLLEPRTAARLPVAPPVGAGETRRDLV